MSEATFNELVHTAMDIARDKYKTTTGEAQHWYARAIDHLDDALTRYNGATYHDRGVFQRPDPDKSGDQ